MAAAEVRKGLGHPFYTKLNAVLGEAGFDPFVEELCAALPRRRPPRHPARRLFSDGLHRLL